MRCLQTDGEKIVSLQARKMKCVDVLIPLLREQVRPLIDWDMAFDELVSIAEKILTTTKLTVAQQPVQKQKQFRQCSTGRPMVFQKLEYKLPPNIAAAKQTGALHPDAKNSLKFGPIPNAEKDKTQYKIFYQPNLERDQLAKEGKGFL